MLCLLHAPRSPNNFLQTLSAKYNTYVQPDLSRTPASVLPERYERHQRMTNQPTTQTLIYNMLGKKSQYDPSLSLPIFFPIPGGGGGGRKRG